MGATSSRSGHQEFSDLELDDIACEKACLQTEARTPAELVDSHDFFGLYLRTPTNSSLHLQLIVQHFIELNRQGLAVAALHVAREYLTPHLHESVDAHGGAVRVAEVLGLLCYDQAETSPLRGLLSSEQRTFVVQQSSEHFGVKPSSCLRSFWKCLRIKER